MQYDLFRDRDGWDCTWTLDPSNLLHCRTDRPWSRVRVRTRRVTGPPMLREITTGDQEHDRQLRAPPTTA
jgi:hypothetical protein